MKRGRGDEDSSVVRRENKVNVKLERTVRQWRELWHDKKDRKNGQEKMHD